MSLYHPDIDPPEPTVDIEAVILDVAQECAESPDVDEVDREYLTDCIGRVPTKAEWFGFLKARERALLKIADEIEQDKN